MMRILLQVLGLLIAVVSVVPFWFFNEARLAADRSELEAESILGPGSRMARADAEKMAATLRENAQQQRTERNWWLGAGIGGVVVGVGVAGLAGARKRKTRVSPAEATSSPAEMPAPPPA